MGVAWLHGTHASLALGITVHADAGTLQGQPADCCPLVSVAACCSHERASTTPQHASCSGHQHAGASLCILPEDVRLTMSPAVPASVAVARATGHPSAVAAQARRSPRYTSSCPFEAATSMLQVPALACSHVCGRQLQHQHKGHSCGMSCMQTAAACPAAQRVHALWGC